MKFKIYSTYSRYDGCGTKKYIDILEKYKLSQKDGIETIEISTLEELLKLQIELGQEIIVYDGEDHPEIEIYDYYRE